MSVIYIAPATEIFARDSVPKGTSTMRILSLAREIQRTINGWYDEEREHEDELRSLKGFDPTEIAEKF